MHSHPVLRLSRPCSSHALKAWIVATGSIKGTLPKGHHPPATPRHAMALSKPINAVQQLLFKITSDGSLRGTTTPDNGEIFSIYDFITKACAKVDTGGYARKTFSNLVKPGSQFKEEVEKIVLNRFLPGSGCRTTPCTDIRGLQCILTILGSKVSEEYRALLNETFLRYMAGDRTMITEIEDNAGSDAPMQILARDALSRAAAVEGPAAAPAIEPAAVHIEESPDDNDETRTVSDDAPLGDDAGDDERMMLVRRIATDLKMQTVIAQQHATTNAQLVAIQDRTSAALVMQAQQFCSTMALQAQQVEQANAATEKERHLRHQADGRYGNGIREATKEVRKRAAEADARAAAADARAAEDRREHLKAIHDAARRVAEAEARAAEERRIAAESHQLLADTLAKLVRHFAPNV